MMDTGFFSVCIDGMRKCNGFSGVELVIPAINVNSPVSDSCYPIVLGNIATFSEKPWKPVEGGLSSLRSVPLFILSCSRCEHQLSLIDTPVKLLCTLFLRP